MQREFETPAPVTVRVRNKAGEVEIRTHQQPVTRVEVEALDPSGEELVGNTRIAQSGSGRDQQVTVEVSDDSSGGASGGFLRRVIKLAGDGPRVRVAVACPEGSAVDVQTASASVEAKAVLGRAEVSTASGDVRLPQVDGEVRVRTASGDIEVASAGGDTRLETASGDVRAGQLRAAATAHSASGDVDIRLAEGHLRVQTASGDIRVGEASGDCEVKTMSGDLYVERLATGRAVAESVSGDVVIGVAKGTAVAVDAQSVTGDLSSEIQLDGEPAAAGSGPSLDLRIRTVSGDAQLRRA